MKIEELQLRSVVHIPDELEDGILYVSYLYGIAIHRCACGCGHQTVTPLDAERGWTIAESDGRVTLDPSIGNFSFHCHSHYWVRDSKIVWC